MALPRRLSDDFTDFTDITQFEPEYESIGGELEGKDAYYPGPKTQSAGVNAGVGAAGELIAKPDSGLGLVDPIAQMTGGQQSALGLARMLHWAGLSKVDPVAELRQEAQKQQLTGLRVRGLQQGLEAGERAKLTWHLSGAGRTLLSRMDDDQREQYINAKFPKMGEYLKGKLAYQPELFQFTPPWLAEASQLDQHMWKKALREGDLARMVKIQQRNRPKPAKPLTLPQMSTERQRYRSMATKNVERQYKDAVGRYLNLEKLAGGDRTVASAILNIRIQNQERFLAKQSNQEDLFENMPVALDPDTVQGVVKRIVLNPNLSKWPVPPELQRIISSTENHKAIVKSMVEVFKKTTRNYDGVDSFKAVIIPRLEQLGVHDYDMQNKLINEIMKPFLEVKKKKKKKEKPWWNPW